MSKPIPVHLEKSKRRETAWISTRFNGPFNARLDLIGREFLCRFFVSTTGRWIRLVFVLISYIVLERQT